MDNRYYRLNIAVLALLISSVVLMPQILLADTGAGAWTDSGNAKQEATAQNVQSAPNTDLLQKVDQLSKKVEELETKLAEKAQPAPESDRLKLLEDRLSAQEKVATTSTGGGLNLDSLPSGQFLKDTKISGFVDTSYRFNFNQPATLSNNQPAVGAPGSGTSALLYPFNSGSNDFTLNNAQITLEKTAEPIGYQVKLDYGSDANGLIGIGALNEFTLQTAYIIYKLPIDKLECKWSCLNGLTGNIMAGRFVTMAGAEVIESRDNWNTTRSFMFSSAIPFRHQGVRTNWNYKSWLDLSAGVNNGWDLAVDNNQAKTIETKIGVTPYDWLSTALVYMFGSETAFKSGNQRHLLDLVTTVKNPFKQKELECLNKLTVMFNMDWATEQDVNRFDQAGVGSLEQNDPRLGSQPRLGVSEARWHGYSVYKKYDLFPWWSISDRLEYFQDTDGSRTFRQQDLWDYTLTNQFNVIKNLITRIEYRHDGSDKSVFSNANYGAGGAKTRSYQDLLSLEAIYNF